MSYSLVQLGPADIPRILSLEQKVCIPPIRADAGLLKLRFAYGNTMFGLQKSPTNSTLVSTVAFRYAAFVPHDREDFPTSFAQFSTPDRMPVYWNSAFVYSFNVDPAERKRGKGLEICFSILSAARKRMIEMGCSYIVADGRPACYNGSKKHRQERHEAIPEFRKAIDRYLSDGIFPSEEVLFQEPTWKVYRHFQRNLRALWIIPNFFPTDEPAGGIRVILFGELPRPRLSVFLFFFRSTHS